MQKLIQNIVAISLRNPIIVFFLTALLVVVGIISLKNTPIEAFPDVTNTRARVITQWPGKSAEEVEKFVTLPIMKEMNTVPKKSEVRSISLFGLSVVTQGIAGDQSWGQWVGLCHSAADGGQSGRAGKPCQ